VFLPLRVDRSIILKINPARIFYENVDWIYLVYGRNHILNNR